MRDNMSPQMRAHIDGLVDYVVSSLEPNAALERLARDRMSMTGETLEKATAALLGVPSEELVTGATDATVLKFRTKSPE